MHLNTRNVNTAFKRLVEYFDGQRDVLREAPVVKRQSRNGPVLMIDEPVLVTYSHPRERVLFNAARDANPFFHLYEALWMLAGRDDVAPLAYYNSNIGKIASDDGRTFNGAYGRRWRHARPVTYPFHPTQYATVERKDTDQLDILVSHLKADPTSRRAVLQMWNVEDDLLKIGATPDRSGNAYNPGLKHPASKDVCCNLSVMFSFRETAELKTVTFPDSSTLQYWTKHGNIINHTAPVLDMTVTNRSNDMIWGMLGANFVHFTILQEYMAARLGAEVGVYHHFTNNLHVYESNWKPKEWLAADAGRGVYDEYCNWTTVPLVRDPATFERELPLCVERFAGTTPLDDLTDHTPFEEPFLEEVAGRLLTAFALHKAKDDHGALAVLADCPADDWRIAAEGWIARRIKK